MPLVSNRFQARKALSEFCKKNNIIEGLNIRTCSTLINQRSSDGGIVKGENIPWFLTTEQPTRVFSWTRYEIVDEVLLVDGVEHASQIPLLDTHNRYTVQAVMGSVNDIQQDKLNGFKSLIGNVRFASDKLSSTTEDKVIDRHLTDGSVGYVVNQSVWISEDEEVSVKGKRYKGPLSVVYGWTLKEFSITPIGADNLAKVANFLKSI